MDIDSMVAGPEMDALIAERVFGEPMPTEKHEEGHIFTVVTHGKCWVCLPDFELGDECIWETRQFSTDIDAAWSVVQLFRTGRYRPGKVACVVEMRYTDLVRDDSECRIFSPDLAPVYGCANDLPLAICKAALKAVE